MNVNVEEYLKRRVQDEEAIKLLLEHFKPEEAVKLLRGADVRVVRQEYLELWEEHCYVHVNVLHGKYEVVDEQKNYCQDGPDIWTVYQELLRIYPPAIIKYYKTPDRVYSGWKEIIILLPPK